MLRTMFVTGSIAVLFAAAAAAQDQGLAPETLEAMKNSTVMVKQKLGPVGGSGSGFVVQVDGDTCLIITNEHVIHRLDVAKYEAEIADLLRQYPAGPEHGRLVALRDGMRGAKLESTVVFRSNRPDEQEIAYELLVADEDADLAVLKVKGIKQPPKPIDYRHGEKFIETTAVLIVGFPLGEKLSLLSMSHGNPATTFAKGSISSLRYDDAGQLVYVQIDGAMNPGNSGGPVLDMKGRLVGVAVARINEAHIGLAIPPVEVIKVFQGKASKPSFGLRQLKPGEVDAEARTSIVDPLGKVKQARLLYRFHASSAKPNGEPPKTLVDEPESHSWVIPASTPWNAHKFTIPVAGPKLIVIDAQTIVTYVDGSEVASKVERTVWTQPDAGTLASSSVPGQADQPERSMPDPPRLQPNLPVRPGVPPGLSPEEFAAQQKRHAEMMEAHRRRIEAASSRMAHLSAPPVAPKDEKELKALIKTLEGNDAQERTQAAESLALVKKPFGPRRDVQKALLTMLEGDDYVQTMAALKALDVWGDSQIVPDLKVWFDRTDHPYTRKTALAILGRIGGDAAIEVIVSCLGHPTDRRPVGAALKPLNPAAETAVLAYLRDAKNDEMRLAACDVLAEIGTSRSEGPITLLAGSSNGVLSLKARVALKKIRSRGQ